MFDIVIVANGNIPTKNDWSDIGYSLLVCTDGAAITLRQFDITPNIILGDFDSLGVDELSFPHSELQRSDDQETTDFEKALQYCLRFPDKKILCLGTLGGSADHAIYNLSLVTRYSDKLDLTLLNPTPEGHQWIFKLKANMRIYTPIKTIISFFPFHEATLNAPALEWPLTHTHITQLGSAAVRNRTTAEITDIECQGECLCFISTKHYPVVL
ncbi:thiamine diphosphokinase [Candidatus Berkiella aquae]|uniref:Thiamine diphosphokinase n=1 Tax=Candidatus Berkiella aquae TaxID=295108 RepID=A0A0Q9YVB5_9GAMM|nr:thiamine diphosphokinase [Candidatus Berkiella aquae]MCS5711361.1 thiamine diphosphokinase [Candidatus Berkiella aquae]